MEKYCLIRVTENNIKSYFIGKLINRHNNKFDYWESNSLKNKMNVCTYSSYSEALKMKIECLFIAKKLYKISLVWKIEKGLVRGSGLGYATDATDVIDYDYAV